MRFVHGHVAEAELAQDLSDGEDVDRSRAVAQALTTQLQRVVIADHHRVAWCAFDHLGQPFWAATLQHLRVHWDRVQLALREVRDFFHVLRHQVRRTHDEIGRAAVVRKLRQDVGNDNDGLATTSLHREDREVRGPAHLVRDAVLVRQTTQLLVPARQRRVLEVRVHVLIACSTRQRRRFRSNLTGFRSILRAEDSPGQRGRRERH
ncbi:hypothetical protein D3C86_1441740 [compost metagenome]